jgi:hypothetical protein
MDRQADNPVPRYAQVRAVPIERNAALWQVTATVADRLERERCRSERDERKLQRRTARRHYGMAVAVGTVILSAMLLMIPGTRGTGRMILVLAGLVLYVMAQAQAGLTPSAGPIFALSACAGPGERARTRREGRPCRRGEPEHDPVAVRGIPDEHPTADGGYLHAVTTTGCAALSPRDAQSLGVGHRSP